MQIDLVNKFKITNTPYVLYDQATKKFKSLNMKDKHELFKKLNLSVSVNEGNELTLFTSFNKEENKYSLRKDRPILILSSTSYTPDEDFMVLINSLDKLQDKLN